MKKLILFLGLISVVSISCSNDDDSSSSDPLIGTWQFNMRLENDVEVALNPCEYEDTLEVSANGTYTSTDYEDLGNGCEVDSIDTGTWENLGDGAYSTTESGESDALVQEIFFEANTMYFESTFNGTTIRFVYIRL